MSRVGAKPIALNGIKVEVTSDRINFSNSNKAPLSVALPKDVIPLIEGDILKFSAKEESARPLLGTIRQLSNNAVHGLTKGFQTNLSLVGVGYKVSANAKSLVFKLGFSHEINYTLPEGVSAEVSGTQVVLKATDKQLLGVAVSKIVSFKPVEPYKGKGIIKEGQFILRKVRKKTSKK